MTVRSAAIVLTLLAAAPGVATRAADAERGAELGYTCHGCHGIENYKNAFPVYSVPKLGGQHAAYLVVALKAYASQERGHATMHAQATTLEAAQVPTLGCTATPIGVVKWSKAHIVVCQGVWSVYVVNATTR